MTNYIGWQATDYAATIKQGSSGEQQAVMTFAEDAQPSNYDDWTAQVLFSSPYTGAVVIELTPDVTPDAEARTLTIDLVFTPDMTENLKPGLYTGDIIMTSTSQGRYLPLNKYSLTITSTV